MSRTTRLWITKLVVAGMSAALCLLAIELGAIAIERVFVRSPHLEMVEFRLTQPPPYQRASYYSKEFVWESFRQPGGFDVPKGTRLVIPNDYASKWFNVIDGLRVTTGQPKKFRNTIWVFGGSTVYSGEVPDEFTLTSQLQSLVSKDYGDHYRVENYGMTTVTTSQEFERLRTIAPKPRDIVIFYDGVNDVFQEIYYGRPKETMVERNRRVMEEFSGIERFLIDLSRHSVFVRNFIRPINYVDVPPHLRDRGELSAMVYALERRFRKNILGARDYAHRRRADFFHFLQPNLYTVKSPSAYEKRIVQNPHLYAPPGMDTAFEVAYPRLRDVSRSLRADDKLNAFDLSEIFDVREPGVEHYLDICHVTDLANHIIASRIFEKIKPSLSARFRD